ncbi:unnamed protein product [Paramecium octaurelia]|uniref:B30.2/SPRY domain-containing protein n=1 Tax=Paramecium octaurelia TaxID=43137 RepID=A0A8S1XWT4_PAROT|nr:unnamed protein product [Paramecium octaurelia]
MNQILCKYHPDNQAIFLLWNSETLKIACEECYENFSNSDYGQKFKKLTIRKALKEPDYFIKQFDLDEKSKTIMSSLENIPETILTELIEKIEKSIQEMSIILEKVIIEMKDRVCLLIQSRNQLRYNLEKNSYYSQFIKLIDNLNSQQFVTHEFVNEAENKIKELFLQINNNKAVFNSEVQEQLNLPKLAKQAGISQINELQNRMNQFRREIHPFLVHNYNKSLTFSKVHKNMHCLISQNGKTVETSLNCYQSCLCDQMIPNYGVTQFAFLIVELTNVMIGVGNKSIVESRKYELCNNLGGGAYSISNSGQCYSHDQIINNKSTGFGFSKNDIIIVEIDISDKYIKWTKQSTNQSFVMAINTTLNLQPCLQFIGKGKVEIIDFYSHGKQEKK